MQRQQQTRFLKLVISIDGNGMIPRFRNSSSFVVKNQLRTLVGYSAQNAAPTNNNNHHLQSISFLAPRISVQTRNLLISSVSRAGSIFNNNNKIDLSNNLPAPRSFAPPSVAVYDRVTSTVARRYLFGFLKSRKIDEILREADIFPKDADKQAAALQALNEIDPSIVVSRFESRQYGTNEQAFKEYLKALVLLGRLHHLRADDIIRNAAPYSHQHSYSNYTNSSNSGNNNNQEYPNVPYSQQQIGGVGIGSPSSSSASGSPGSEAAPLFVKMSDNSTKSQIWRTIRIILVAYIILLGFTAFLEDKGIAGGKSNGTSPMSKDIRPVQTSTKKFSDVVGVDEAKAELEEIVMFLKDPAKFTRLGGKIPKGVLLMGPPGTGKTILARAIAGEAGVPFFYASGSEFDEMYVGVGARRVRDLFEAAKKMHPCIIFIDEIDAIGAMRSPKDQQYVRMTLNQLLSEMDGFNPSDGIIVIGATNFPEVLDKALTRPGRFDRHVVVPNPDVAGRKKILELHLKNIPLDPAVDVSKLARGTPGFSGADLANLINVGAIRASTLERESVTMDDLEYAKDKIMMGAERKSAVITAKARKITAFHEGGHAIVATFTPDSVPLHKATIVPRGMALGMVTQLPEEDEFNWTRKQMLAKLDVCMGGRVAEELVFGADEVTSGASSDLEQATKMARLMIERFGMSASIGYVSVQRDSPEISDELKAKVDEEVKQLCGAAYARAKALLTARRHELDLLAEALLSHETLTAEEIKLVLSGQKLNR